MATGHAYHNIGRWCVQKSTPDDESRVEESMHRAFSLAAQYIALAYALQPSKDVYAKSIQARGLRCCLRSLYLRSFCTVPASVTHTCWIALIGTMTSSRGSIV